MSSISRPPEPWLVAVILIVTSRGGPRCVFHTPANPDLEKLLGPNFRRGRGANDFGSDEESQSSSDEEDEEPIGPGGVGSGGGGTAGGSSAGGGAGRTSAANVDDGTSTTASSAGGDSQRPPSLNSGKVRKKADLEDSADLSALGRGSISTSYSAVFDSVFGVPSEVWEKLLSPTRAWHKRRFEIGINDLAFVGWPVFVRDDGHWRKKSRRRKRQKPKSSGEGQQDKKEGKNGQDDDNTNPTSDNDAPDGTQSSRDEDNADKTDVEDNADSQTGSPESDKDTMSMFNVVFVMAPPVLEYSMHLKEMYEHVIKKFSKALKYEQDHSNYVWKEAQHILQIKERARERGTSLILDSEMIQERTQADETRCLCRDSARRTRVKVVSGRSYTFSI